MDNYLDLIKYKNKELQELNEISKIIDSYQNKYFLYEYIEDITKQNKELKNQIKIINQLKYIELKIDERKIKFISDEDFFNPINKQHIYINRETIFYYDLTTAEYHFINYIHSKSLVEHIINIMDKINRQDNLLSKLESTKKDFIKKKI